MNQLSTLMFDQLEPISLEQLVETANLQTRVDRKYLVDAERAVELIGALTEPARVLQIDGRRQFGYRSIYFDTADYDCYLSAARGRPNRCKIRTRTYVDSGQCVVEVKLRDRQRRTVKHRATHDAAQIDRITDEAATFLAGFGDQLPSVANLRPTLETNYLRTTLLCGDARATFDVAVLCTEHAGERSATIADRTIVETKGGTVPSQLDRLLWRAGARPLSLSKYAVGLAALRAELPANRWHRVLHHHVVVTPHSNGAAS